MVFPSSILIGIFLMTFPLWILRIRRTRLTGFDQRGWPSGRTLVLTILDALRASFGAWLLTGALPGLNRVGNLEAWQDPVFLGLIVAAGLAIQAVSWRDEDFLFAPAAYALGVVAALAHPVVLVIALPLAIGSALAVRAWAAGFIGGGVGLAAVGMAVTQQDWRISLCVGAALVFPVLVSVMAGRHLGGPKRLSEPAADRAV